MLNPCNSASWLLHPRLFLHERIVVVGVVGFSCLGANNPTTNEAKKQRRLIRKPYHRDVIIKTGNSQCFPIAMIFMK
jgi:hypothetical protein